MSRCECTRCHYCGMWVGPRHEHDHPVPRCVGGTDTVPACRGCHDLLDRTTLDDWPAGLVSAAAASLPAEVWHAAAAGDPHALTLPAGDPAGRLMVAKLARVWHLQRASAPL